MHPGWKDFACIDADWRGQEPAAAAPSVPDEIRRSDEGEVELRAACALLEDLEWAGEEVTRTRSAEQFAKATASEGVGDRKDRKEQVDARLRTARNGEVMRPCADGPAGGMGRVGLQEARRNEERAGKRAARHGERKAPYGVHAPDAMGRAEEQECSSLHQDGRWTERQVQ